MARRKTVAPTPAERKRGMMILELNALVVFMLSIVLSYLFVTYRLDAIAQYAPSGRAVLTLELFLFFLFFFFLVRLVKKETKIGAVVSLILATLIYGGAALLFGSFYALIVTVGAFVWHKGHNTYFSNNLYVLFAVLLGAIPVGFSYSIPFLVLVMLLFSIYDVIGVFLLPFIPNLAHRAVQMNVPLLIAAPRIEKDWHKPMDDTKTSAILGAGDILLPALFLSAVTMQLNPVRGMLVLVGVLVGYALNTLLALTLRRGVPAMPLISAGMIAGLYLFGV